LSSATFQAFGGEARSYRDPRVTIGYVGAFQFVVYGILVGVHLLVFFPPVAVVSLIVCTGSLGIFVGLRLTEALPKTCDFHYVSNKATGGERLLSYVNSRNKDRTNLMVEKIEPDPRHGAYLKAGRVYFPATGTKASLAIHFRDQKWFYLLLGFPSAEEMEKIATLFQ
jgi:hypothetical protein